MTVSGSNDAPRGNPLTVYVTVGSEPANGESDPSVRRVGGTKSGLFGSTASGWNVSGCPSAIANPDRGPKTGATFTGETVKRTRWAAESSPEEVRDYLNRNQSFVFFTPIDGNPHGSLDVEVTGGRSLATDKTLFPRGALVFIESEKPEPPMNRFLFDQDTGGAIRTAGRADIYLGIGPEAEEVAGRTKVEGQLYYLFLKDVAE